MAETLIDLPFPLGGVDLSQGLLRQPKRQAEGYRQRYTTPTGQNVRSQDPALRRERGGSRPGLSKFVAAAVVADWLIQELGTVSVSGGGDLPGGGRVSNSSGRAVQCIAVCQGNVFAVNAGDVGWTSATNNTGNSPPFNYSGVLYSAENNQKLYFADGTNWAYYDPRRGEVNTWTASAGTLPADSENNAPRLICTWRGRTVLSGLLQDPQNIFFSRVNDPHDWDYAPAEKSPVDAVALNLAPQGFVGDLVTALIPYSDDVLVVGCDHHVYLLRGDPAAGGQVDLVSDTIGIAWGVAWCKDPYGTLYFFSNRGGIYSLVPGQAPLRVSQAIEQLVQEVDTGTNAIRMIWDDRYQGLHVFVTPLAAPADATHYFFEARTGAWWTDVFADDDHNPLCCAVFDGNEPDDRALLLGCWDGYVRKLDLDADDDDGTAIASEVVLGPILTATTDDMLLKELQATLGEDSGDVAYAVHVGAHPEAALAATAAVSGTWSEGRNPTAPVRRAGHAVYVKLTSSVQWALEGIRMVFAGKSKVRRRAR
jgi:hypothetical protein